MEAFLVVYLATAALVAFVLGVIMSGDSNFLRKKKSFHEDVSDAVTIVVLWPLFMGWFLGAWLRDSNTSDTGSDERVDDVE